MPEGLTIVLLGALVSVVLVFLYFQLSRWLDGPGSLAPVALYTDTSARMGVEEIAALDPQQFEPMPSQMALGYSSSARWFRLVAPPDTLFRHLVVSVQPSYLDNVRFYLPDSSQPSGWRVEQQGDRFAFADRSRKDLAFAADAWLEDGEVVLVRVQTRNAHSLRVRMLEADDATQENALTLASVGVYCGAVLVLGLASALSAVVYRDRYWAVNALFQLATLVTMFVYFGLASQFFLDRQPAVADMLSLVCGFVQFFLGTLFYRLFYEQYGMPRWLLVLQSVALGVLALQLVMVLSGQIEAALRLYALTVGFVVFLGVAALAVLQCQDSFMRNLLRLNLLSTTMFFVLLGLSHLGWLSANFMQLYPGVFINLLTAVVLHLALLRHNTLLAREQGEARRALLVSQEQVAMERRQREEEGHFFGMLMHEMRSPLAVIAVAVGSLQRKLRALVPEETEHDGLSRNVRRIEESVGQMRGVLQQVQAVSEMEHSLRHEPARSPQVAHGVTRMGTLFGLVHAREAEQERVQLRGMVADPEASTWAEERVIGGRLVLEMMICNLVDNALKYSLADTPVVLDAQLRETGVTEGEGAGRCLAVTVTNRVGDVGMPDPERLFSKYYRAPGAHQFSGSGLGLYWVRGMTRMLGGDVQYGVEGADQVRFSLILPLVDDKV